MYLTVLGHPINLFSPFSPAAAPAEGGENPAAHTQYQWLTAATCCVLVLHLSGWTGYAAETNHVCGCWFLLNLSVLDCMNMPFAGGEIDCVDKDGNTPLHVAARYGHELLINTLITSGADTAK